jgi:DNA polymerase-3 subunit epsilon
MLLDTARKPTRRIFAEHAPYDQKNRLRARGFRWNPGTDGRPRAWHREVEESAVSAELEYLNTEIYGRPVELLVQPVTAWSRFSARTG